VKYYVLIHKEEDNGYWGECPELPGCFSQGDTPDELMENMREAVSLYLEDDVEITSSQISEVRELVV
jgi:predicted RNase H-like HicB family nuclease